MSFLSYKHGFSPKIELKSKECIDLVLQPLKYHVTIKVNGSLTSEDIFRTVVSMAVDNNSVHSVSKQYQDVACETSLRYHLKKLNMEELIKSNEKILLQELIKTLKTGKSYEFAIDLTDDPYYGKTDSSNEKYVIHGQAKKSTNSFYSYASLHITTVFHQLDQKIIYPHHDFKHLTEKHFEIGMKLNDFLIQLVKYWK